MNLTGYVNFSKRDVQFLAYGHIELHTPTNAAAMPTKSDVALEQLLGHERVSHEPKLPTSHSTAKRLARLGALSRSTQERGLTSWFHLSTPGSLSVIAATAQLCQAQG
jgi:hypothetical protein